MIDIPLPCIVLLWRHKVRIAVLSKKWKNDKTALDSSLYLLYSICAVTSTIRNSDKTAKPEDRKGGDHYGRDGEDSKFSDG